MGIREDRNYLKERRAEREALRENARKQESLDFNNRAIERENIIAAHEAKLDRFYQYKEDVKTTLLKEALMNIYIGSMDYPTDRQKAVCENLLMEYINETGTSKLLKNMRLSESGILITIAENVNKYFDIITEDAEFEDENTQTIDPKAIEDFWKEIDNSEDIDDITNIIRLRVANAEEEFINKNHEDKENIKTIISQTSQRVQNAKDLNDNDYEEAVEVSESRIAKDKIYKIQHEGRHNVFDRMVRNISEVVMKDENMKAEFTTDNGRLNMRRIVESARCMYTLLEMVGTIQLEKVDQKYIEESLKSIK